MTHEIYSVKTQEEMQAVLDQACRDIQQESSEQSFFDALGRVSYATHRPGVIFTEEQREVFVRAINARGYRTIGEYLSDPSYLRDKETGFELIVSRWIAGNILDCLRSHESIPLLPAISAFQYSDQLAHENSR